jgi:hypothetical protein
MEARDFLRDFGYFDPIENELKAPWILYPGIDIQDMFWRMGKGEDYLMRFYNYFEGLADREKVIFKLTNPTPYNWRDFYE